MSTLTFGRPGSTDIYTTTWSARGTDDTVNAELNKLRRRVQRTASAAQSLALDALARAFADCSSPNWDGYGAAAVTWEVAARAQAFLNALPASLVAPDVVAEPDGALAVEWYFDKTLQLSISIGASGPLHFAGVIGHDYGQPRVRHGMEPFETTVPAELLRYIHELHRRAGSAARHAA